MTRKIPVYDDYPQIGRVRLDPSLALANSDPLLIARGLVTGISQVNKFGLILIRRSMRLRMSGMAAGRMYFRLRQI